MNVLMASVSAQLLMYSIAWLVLGLGYRLKRNVALQWSLGWFLGACSTGLLFSLQLNVPYRFLVTDTLIVGAFFLLRAGVYNFTNGPGRWRWDVVPVMGMLVALEFLRRVGISDAMGIALFTLCASWPLAGMAWRMGRWQTQQTRTSRWVALIKISPVLLTIGLFAVRAVLVGLGTDANTVALASDSNFDLVVTMLFLVVLGVFNFSLASLIIGSLIERLRTLSATDQLTGLANRRVMMRRLVEEHARFLRSGQVYSIVMMDLDHFKKVNDTHGHGVGDQVLKGLANLLQSGLRQTDTLARTGGEEFMLLMPMTDVDGAVAHAKRLCEKVARATMATDAGVQQITLSLGVSEAGMDDVSPEVVVSRADAAMYRAKAAGRNRVESAPRVVMPGWVL